MSLRHLNAQVADPALREKLRPRYAMGCKRILPTDEWYPALVQPNVELVTGGIREVRAHSIVGADGEEREVDTIIFGTGFHVTDIPIATRIRGRDGRTLAEAWGGSPSAYKGSAVAGYPNLFFLVGPNTGLGHNSIVFMIEAQIQYLTGALRALRPQRSAHDRGAPRGAGRLQRRDRPHDGGHRLGLGWLRELVHRRERAQRHALADVHLAVPPARCASSTRPPTRSARRRPSRSRWPRRRSPRARWRAAAAPSSPTVRTVPGR